MGCKRGFRTVLPQYSAKQYSNHIHLYDQYLTLNFLDIAKIFYICEYILKLFKF